MKTLRNRLDRLKRSAAAHGRCRRCGAAGGSHGLLIVAREALRRHSGRCGTCGAALILLPVNGREPQP